MLTIVAICPSICFAEATWSYGYINITESFAIKVFVRWTGPSTQSCNDNDAAFDATSLGSDEAVARAFSIALTATASEKPIRFKLDGCLNGLQKATAVQLCKNSDCSY